MRSGRHCHSGTERSEGIESDEILSSPNGSSRMTGMGKWLVQNDKVGGLRPLTAYAVGAQNCVLLIRGYDMRGFTPAPHKGQCPLTLTRRHGTLPLNPYPWQEIFPFPKKIYKIRFTFSSIWFTIEYAIYNVGDFLPADMANVKPEHTKEGGL